MGGESVDVGDERTILAPYSSLIFSHPISKDKQLIVSKAGKISITHTKTVARQGIKEK